MKEELDKLKAMLVTFVTEAIEKAGLAKNGHEVYISNINHTIDWDYRYPHSGYNLYSGWISWQNVPDKDTWDDEVAALAKSLEIRYGQAEANAKRVAELKEVVEKLPEVEELNKLGYTLQWYSSYGLLYGGPYQYVSKGCQCESCAPQITP